MALSANQFFSWLCSLFSTSFCNSAFLEQRHSMLTLHAAMEAYLVALFKETKL